MPRILPLLVALGLLATAAPAAGAATALYPDMRTLPPRDLRFDYTGTAQGNQHVLRFTNTVWNAGEGALMIGGTVPEGATSVPATQRVRYDDGTTASYDVGNYEIHREHQHFHYDGWGRYELWTKAEYDRWIAEGRPASLGPDLVGAKTTSCVLDEEFISTLPGTPYPRVYPDAGCDPTINGTIDSGLSVGWGDTYDHYRYEQWIPLGSSRLADGDYVLRSVTDPENKVHESDGKRDPARESQIANEATTLLRIANGQIQDLHRPSGTVLVNNIDAKTATTNVNVRVLGRDDVSGISRVRVSNDGVSWKEWAYGGSGSSYMSIAWDLADTATGGSTDKGIRTVYAQFLDNSGKWSASETDTIELTTGTTPPSGSNSEYVTQIMGDAPVGFWRLGETFGTAAADATALNPGTYSGVGLGAPSLLNSDADRAATFDGSSSFVRTGAASSLDLGGALSLEAWIRPDAIPSAGDWASVVTRPEAYSLQFNGPRLEFTVIQSGVRRRLQAPIGAVVAGERYHVLGTYDGAEQRLYLNGQLVASAALTGPASAGWGGLHIGSWDGTMEFFDGTIDEVAIYSKMLTGLQAKQHYDAGIATAVGVPTPSSLAATAISSSAINVSWIDTSGNETGFVLERSTSSTFTSPTAIPLPAGTASYTDTGRAAGTTYWYRVRAVTATDTSAWSNVASATTQAATVTAPAAPSALTGTAPLPTRVDLAWRDNATNETGHVLERATNSRFKGAIAISLPAGATSHADTGVSASTSYWYRVRAVNGAGSSGWSNVASVTTPATPPPPPPPPPTVPAAPTGLTAGAASASAIDLGWADNASDETGYVLQRSTSSTFASVVSIPLPPGATSHQDTGLAAATSYWYRVQAVNGAGASGWSNTASATTQSVSTTPAYASAVAADAPVSHWRLGETSGTTAADVLGRNPGTYRNGALLGQASLLANDATNGAVRLDGVNDEVRAADSASLDLTSAFSVEAWIRPDAIPSAGGWASLVTKAESYSLQFNGPLLEFTVIQSGVRRRLQAPSGTIVAGRTYHVVGTYDGVNQRLYVNGSQVAFRAQTGPASVTTWPLTIGTWNGGEPFRGTIDEVALYDTTLAATSVAAHHSAGGTTTATAASARRTLRLRRARPARRAKPSLLGPAQRRTYARPGPGDRRVRPLPARSAKRRS